MGHSQAEKAASRERILDAAARQMREAGLESLSIAELMKAAHLTHGGFYGHFPSRAALISAALERALDQGEAAFVAAPSSKSPGTVKSIVNRYLSRAHRDNHGSGCAMASLAGDVARSDDGEVRTAMSQRFEASIARMAQAMGGSRAANDAALMAWCAMVGAIALSRIAPDEARSDEILKVARQGVLALEAHVRAADHVGHHLDAREPAR